MALKGASITEIDGLETALMGSALGFGGMLQNYRFVHMCRLWAMRSALMGLNAPFLLWACSGLAGDCYALDRLPQAQATALAVISFGDCHVTYCSVILGVAARLGMP